MDTVTFVKQFQTKESGVCHDKRQMRPLCRGRNLEIYRVVVEMSVALARVPSGASNQSRHLIFVSRNQQTYLQLEECTRFNQGRIHG